MSLGTLVANIASPTMQRGVALQSINELLTNLPAKSGEPASSSDTASFSEPVPPKATVTMDWWGNRWVTVRGHTGRVNLNTLVTAYLSLSPDDSNWSLRERLQFHALWPHVAKLCQNDTCLKETKIYKYLVPFVETLVCCCRSPCILPRPIDLMAARYRNFASFTFPRSEFRALFPKQEPVQTYESGLYCLATREMVLLKVPN